ncbi:MAG: phage tail protein [Thermodesulfobacteriota bacterium]
MARTPLFKRMPSNVRRLDGYRDNVLERFLGVVDDGFDGALETAKALLDLRDPDRILDRYLPLIGTLVGHRWRSDRSRDWNRRRIRDAIRRYSYKGTLEAVGDLVREHGGGPWNVTDMASTVLVWSRQGRHGAPDSHYFDADVHHAGVFLLRVTDQVNLAAFLEDFEFIRPAGTRWYFEVATCRWGSFEMVWGQEREILRPAANMGARRWNFDLFWDREPQLPSDRLITDLVWIGSAGMGSGLFNESLFWDHAPALPTEMWITPLVWVGSAGSGMAPYGELCWDWEPQWPVLLELEISARAVSGGSITVDSPLRINRQDIFINMGTPENPLTDELALEQPVANRAIT